jgi:hypothetical protein
MKIIGLKKAENAAKSLRMTLYDRFFKIILCKLLLLLVAVYPSLGQFSVC